jgi:putative endonuclease
MNRDIAPSYKKSVGSAAERLALNYLKSKGFGHQASNVSFRQGEIDIVMEDGAVLVFVEVKFRTDDSFGGGREAITAIKRRHMMRAALAYVQHTRQTDKMMRFDVVLIGRNGVEHVPNAFEADGSCSYY